MVSDGCNIVLSVLDSYGICVIYFFFFKQKTAYEMRISDWSSDVCSSDLFVMNTLSTALKQFVNDEDGVTAIEYGMIAALIATALVLGIGYEIGRASCRERVCQYV